MEDARIFVCCSVTKSYLTLCDPVNYSTACFPVLLSPEVCWNSCALSQWCHPTILSSVTSFSSCPQSFPVSGCFPVSWLFASAGQSILQLQHQSFQWIFKVDFLWDWLVWSPCCPRDSQESSPASRLESINSVVSSLLYGPTLNLHMTTGKTISCMLEKMPKGNLKI